MRGALSGVHVLDFTEYIAGPFAGQTLADMGADVTKIEPPQGDFFRLTNPSAPNESRGFITVNRGKRSVAIDLKKPEGLAILNRNDVALVNDNDFGVGVPAGASSKMWVIRLAQPIF